MSTEPNETMPNTRRTKLKSAVFLAASLTLVGPSAALADTAMGYLGLVDGQIARVQVANPLSGGQPCQVQISLVDTSGQTVVMGKTTTLVPGEATTLEVSGNVIASGGRQEIRPVVDLIPPVCRLSALVSAEVVDINQVVRVFWPPVPFYPPGPVRFGLIHVPPGEVARLTAVNLFPPDSIRLRVRFLDAQGQTLNQQMVTVAPGTSAALDLSGDGSAVRAEITEIVPPDGLPHWMFATGEVFNAGSGKTKVAWPPDPIHGIGGIVNK